MRLPLVLLASFFLSVPALAEQPSQARRGSESAFADAVLQAMRSGDIPFLERAFDRRSFLTRTVSEVIDEPSTRRAFVDGAFQTFLPFQNMVGQGMKFRFKGVRVRDGRKSLLFRTLHDNGGTNFLLLAIRRDRAGTWEIRDIYAALAGSWTSDVLKRVILVLNPPSSGMARVKKILGFSTKSKVEASLPDVLRFVNSAKKGQVNEVVETYAKLPETLKQQVWIQVMRVSAVNRLGIDHPLYEEVVADVARRFANDASLSLLLLDGLVVSGKTEEALRAVRAVNKEFGPDAYLDFIEGNLHHQRGQPNEAIAAYQRARKAEPDLEAVYSELVAQYVLKENFAKAAAMLEAYHGRFKKRHPALPGLDQWARFTKSKAYRRAMANAPTQ